MIKKAREYSAYLVARGHNPFTVELAFKNVRELSVTQSRQKVSGPSKVNKPIFLTKYNPLGPNIQMIMKKQAHLLRTVGAMSVLPNGVMTAFKRERNLKELLTRADPYTIKTPQCVSGGFTPCGKKCDSCQNFVQPVSSVTSFATGKIFFVRPKLNCNSKYVVYCAVCSKCKKQGVGSTVDWKPRLRNYKSHVKKKLLTCGIVKHFVEDCVDTSDPCGHIQFILVDCVTNADNLSSEALEDLLLAKEKFWIGTLVTQHAGMNRSHDWNRSCRTEKFEHV